VQVPSATADETDTVSGSALFTNAAMPITVAAKNEKEQLITAVTNMALSQPAIEFANRFLFTTDMVVGGQGIVVFARGRDAGMRQFAIKCVSLASSTAGLERPALVVVSRNQSCYWSYTGTVGMRLSSCLDYS
jgi:hypothetical protein